MFWFCCLTVSALARRAGGGAEKGGKEEASLESRYPSDCPTGPCRIGGRAWSLLNVIKQEEEEKKEEMKGKSKD